MASKVVMILVLVFALAAFGLAIAAEQRRSKAQVIPDAEQDYNYCVYDSDTATGLGVGALLFLGLSQALVMTATKCFCCGGTVAPGRSRSCAFLFYWASWLTFVVAEICLLAGSVRNAKHTRYGTVFFNNPPSCETLRKGVFAAGAAFALFTAILAEFYYFYYDRARDEGKPHGAPDAGIGMGSYGGPYNY